MDADVECPRVSALPPPLEAEAFTRNSRYRPVHRINCFRRRSLCCRSLLNIWRPNLPEGGLGLDWISCFVWGWESAFGFWPFLFILGSSHLISSRHGVEFTSLSYYS